MSLRNKTKTAEYFALTSDRHQVLCLPRPHAVLGCASVDSAVVEAKGPLEYEAFTEHHRPVRQGSALPAHPRQERNVSVHQRVDEAAENEHRNQ